MALPDCLPPVWADVFAEDAYGVSAEFVWNDVPFCFRWVGPGVFRMGSEHPKDPSAVIATPVHAVTVSSGFWLLDTPVTQAQWRASKLDMDCRFEGEQRPVEQVSWREVMHFVRVLKEAIPGLPARLPSEAEWEYACRAGTRTRFHSGADAWDDLDAVGWYLQNSEGGTKPVRLKVPNAWGLYDMHGNVYEWCRDGVREYSSEPVSNPVGPEDESAGRVFRGGSWFDSARSCRSAYRDAISPEFRNHGVGFRLAAG